MITESAQNLLSGFQLELNVALVGRDSLDPLPLVDEILTMVSGERIAAVEHGMAVWSLDGPRHRMSIRSRHGFDSIESAKTHLADELSAAQVLAAEVDGRWMGTGMHPWMSVETAEIWPHGGASARSSQALQEIFGDARHGFSNQQRLGLSLPFSSEFDFQRLFAALRFALPIFPAITASSPFADRQRGPALNCRLAARRDYFDTALEFSGPIVPKYYSCRAELQAELGRSLEDGLRHHEQLGELQAGDVCGDGMLADFHLGLIHLQVLDMQECLQANLAVCALATAIARNLIWEVDVPFVEQRGWPSARLEEILEPALVDAEYGVIRDLDYLRSFGFPEHGACEMRDLLQFLVEEKLAEDADLQDGLPVLEVLLEKGSLATRSLSALPHRWNAEDLYELYKRVAECQLNDELLV